MTSARLYRNFKPCFAAIIFAFSLSTALVPALANGPKPTMQLSYFEIPVSNMDRAIAFYSAVFGIELEPKTIDGYEMALFPSADGARANGALAKGDVYIPGKAGAILYFVVDNIDDTLALATANGGKVLLEKQGLGAQGFVAEFEDSEDNRIALHQRLKGQ